MSCCQPPNGSCLLWLQLLQRPLLSRTLHRPRSPALCCGKCTPGTARIPAALVAHPLSPAHRLLLPQLHPLPECACLFAAACRLQTLRVSGGCWGLPAPRRPLQHHPRSQQSPPRGQQPVPRSPAPVTQSPSPAASPACQRSRESHLSGQSGSCGTPGTSLPPASGPLSASWSHSPPPRAGAPSCAQHHPAGTRRRCAAAGSWGLP
mmetsp:Transcript_12047/g.25894  ORF Transcript_12047/g.25894 Transcript_12047/m.25894 type:complete len:206 (-) Transcript_12047:1382-1999(-)